MKSKKSKDKTRLGWHMLRDTGKFRYPPYTKVCEGKTYSIDSYETPALCEQGMHASPTMLEALNYVMPGYICKVSIKGDIETDEKNFSTWRKFVGRHRRVSLIRFLTLELRTVLVLALANKALELVDIDTPKSLLKLLSGLQTKAPVHQRQAISKFRDTNKLCLFHKSVLKYVYGRRFDERGIQKLIDAVMRVNKVSYHLDQYNRKSYSAEEYLEAFEKLSRAVEKAFVVYAKENKGGL